MRLTGLTLLCIPTAYSFVHTWEQSASQLFMHMQSCWIWENCQSLLWRQLPLGGINQQFSVHTFGMPLNVGGGKKRGKNHKLARKRKKALVCQVSYWPSPFPLEAHSLKRVQTMSVLYTLMNILWPPSRFVVSEKLCVRKWHRLDYLLQALTNCLSIPPPRHYIMCTSYFDENAGKFHERQNVSKWTRFEFEYEPNS